MPQSKYAVVPDTRLSATSFLITAFTIHRKLSRQGLESTIHTLEVYPCGCTLDLYRPERETVELSHVYTPCGIHELPEEVTDEQD